MKSNEVIGMTARGSDFFLLEKKIGGNGRNLMHNLAKTKAWAYLTLKHILATNTTNHKVSAKAKELRSTFSQMKSISLV